MYSKVINPLKDGKAERRLVTFNNKGSAMRLGNYLEKELDTFQQVDGKIFFNETGNFTKNEMVEVIDNNVKGLTADDHKFYSLVLSPSKAELEHIQNDSEKRSDARRNAARLKAYTIACMENYAQNFQIKTKNGEVKSIQLKDLVWFANIEYDRFYKGDDAEVKQGLKKQGERKKGLQTHIHITVSARDKSMKTTLNPRTSDKKRFSILNWSIQNQKTFDKQFGYESPKKSFENQQKQAWNKVQSVENILTNWQKKLGIEDKDCHRVRAIAGQKNYSHDFRTNLKEISKELRVETAKELNNTQWQRLENTQSDAKKIEKTPHFDLAISFNQGYHFLKGAELPEADGKDLYGIAKKIGRRLAQNVQIEK